MYFNPNANVTLFLSVRKGLENCLLQEIKHNKLLNNINRIHQKREYLYNLEDTDTQPLEGPDPYLSSVELKEEKSQSDNKWIKLANSVNFTQDSITKTKVNRSVHNPVSTHPRDSCDIWVQPGGLEVKCNFDWLLKSSLFIKSAESVWLRVGNPFRCHTEEQLVIFISKLPWNLYFSVEYTEKIPLRIISRNSKVWSSRSIESCVRKGIRLSFEDKVDTENKLYPVEDYCISVTLNRNTCYLALQFSGRLSPRLYNFQFLPENTIDYSKYIPYWSLSNIKKSLLKSRERSENPNNNPEPPSDSFDSKRKNYIDFQNFLTNDLCDTSDSLISAFLQNKEIYKALNSKVETIWDPFCGNGVLICELMSQILALPNFIPETTHPFTTVFTQNLKEYKSKFDEYIETRSPKKNLNIVGSDTSLVKLTEANSKILRFFSFYQNILGKSECKETKFNKAQSLFKSYSFYPVTIHNCPISELSHFMTNSLILTKIPYIDHKDKNKFEKIKLCKEFGQVVSSKPDWKGVFVISRGRFFEYFSGLEWKTLVRSTNSKSEVKLLKWTGRTRQFKSVEEKLDQLNEIDFD